MKWIKSREHLRKKSESMSINLFVGNLAYATSDSSLASAFGPFGEVISSKVILDRETHRSRGFGFVEFADRDAGLKAIEEMNGKEVDGRAISVKEALPKEDRPRRPSGPRSRGPRFE